MAQQDDAVRRAGDEAIIQRSEDLRATPRDVRPVDEDAFAVDFIEGVANVPRSAPGAAVLGLVFEFPQAGEDLPIRRAR